MLRLALPALAEQLLAVLVGFVDMGLTGHILQTDAHVAAMGSIAYLMWLLFSLFAALSIGATAVVSRLIGEQRPQSASLAANQAILLALLLSLPVMLLYGAGGGAVARLLQLEGDSAELAARYLAWLAWVAPLVAVQAVGVAALRGAGDTVSGFLAMGTLNLVNMALSFVLVTGWGPFPELGWDGLAIGTTAAHAVGGLIILGYLLRGRAGLRLQPAEMSPNRDMIARLVRVGLPGGVDVLTILFCHLWYLSIVNAVGTVAAAAHGLGVRIESLAYLPGTAFQIASATMAGQFLGAGDIARARRGAWACCLTGGGFMTVAGLLFFFQGRFFALLFLGDADTPVAVLTADLLQIVAVSMPSLALSMILTGALRGAGDTRWPLAITLCGYLLIRIPGAYWLAWDEIALPLVGTTVAGFGLGAVGAWYAMAADVVFRSLLVTVRFLQGGWTRIRV